MKNRIIIRVVNKKKLLPDFLRYYMEYLYTNTNFYQMFANGTCQNNIRVETLKHELKPLLQYCKIFVMLNESQVLPNDVLIYRVGSAGKVDWTNKNI